MKTKLNLHKMSCLSVCLLSAILMLNIGGAFGAINDIPETPVAVRAVDYFRGIKIPTNKIIDVRVVYDPSDSTSQQAANSIVGYINSKAKIKKGKLQAALLSINDLNSARGSEIYFIAPNTQRGYVQIKDVSVNRHVMTLSFGSDCVRQGYCALAVEKIGSVKVYLNEQILEKTGFDIDSTFRYLAIKI